MKKKQVKRVTKVERGLIVLANYLEDPCHDQYRVRDQILEILGLEEIKKHI